MSDADEQHKRQPMCALTRTHPTPLPVAVAAHATIATRPDECDFCDAPDAIDESRIGELCGRCLADVLTHGRMWAHREADDAALALAALLDDLCLATAAYCVRHGITSAREAIGAEIASSYGLPALRGAVDAWGFGRDAERLRMLVDAAESEVRAAREVLP